MLAFRSAKRINEIIMASKDHIDNLMLSAEFNLITQDQVVSEYRELVSKDIGQATLKYTEYAQKLETVSSDGNAQIRMAIGGPDMGARAGLVDVLTAKYETASNEVKAEVLKLALRPIAGDNILYVQMAVARMSNPHLIGDIARLHPMFTPHPDFYGDYLRKQEPKGPAELQSWLDGLGANFFAASTLALQNSQTDDVTLVIEANQELFEGAAHIVAARHDRRVEEKLAKDSSITKSKAELLVEQRVNYVPVFQEMVARKIEDAHWLPLRD